MYVKIHGNRDYVKGNKQSCKDLVAYLEKENEGIGFVEKEMFFDQKSFNVDDQLVVHAIDNNKKGLKADDAKFFMITVNPSERELKHLAKIATNGNQINNISELNTSELERYNNLLKDYCRIVMDQYAQGFNKGLTGKDLVYFGKLEQERHYKGTDEEVKNGTAKTGELKPGLQTHVHIIVSRKDSTQKVSISPLANSKASKNHKLNGKSVTVGLDRESFIKSCEQEFDKNYRFKREYTDTFAYYQHQANPFGKVSRYSRIATQALENPEIAVKAIAISTMEKINDGSIPLQELQMTSRILQKPESIKDQVIQKLDQLSNQLLPPEIRTAKKIAEQAVKPIKGLSTGLEI